MGGDSAESRPDHDKRAADTRTYLMADKRKIGRPPVERKVTALDRRAAGTQSVWSVCTTSGHEGTVAVRGNGHVVEYDQSDEGQIKVRTLATVGPQNAPSLGAADIQRVCRKARPGKYVGQPKRVRIVAGAFGTN